MSGSLTVPAQASAVADDGFPARIVCVLGMHRSGTSCLTGSLQEAGLHLGDCHTWNPFNQKGNRENQDFVDLHDDILEANGGSWDCPPEQVIWTEQQLQRGRELLQRYQGIEVMGFKDPRTLLVLAGWKTITDKLEFVGIFRHPVAVADSLKRRSQKSRAEALALWYEYNRRLFTEYQRSEFPIICFDHSQHDFQARLDDMLAEIGLAAVAHEERFYDKQLKSFEGRLAIRVPWENKAIV